MQRRPYSFELAAERSLTPLHDRLVLDAIYKHQNPARCDTAKYLVHSLAHRHNGFGSTLHVLSAILGVAMQNNRILIVAQDLKRCQANDVTFESTGSRRWAWSDARFCPAPDGARGLACLFNSSSRCLAYVNDHRDQIVEVNDYRPTTLNSHHPFVTSRRVCDGAQCGSQYSRPERLAPGPFKSQREYSLTFGRGWHVARPAACRRNGTMAPARPLHLVPLTRPPSKKGKWRAGWWRTLAIEHLLRPRDHVVRWLREQADAFWGARGGVPANLISVHVRWGDLAAEEMGIVPVTAYVQAVRWLAASRGLRADGRLELIVTTEDPAALAAFRAAAPAVWRLHVYEYERHATLGEAGGERSIGSTSLLQLFLALEARLFVCTTGSNWCRLINELRKTRLDRSAGCGGNCTLFADLCYGEW